MPIFKVVDEEIVDTEIKDNDVDPHTNDGRVVLTHSEDSDLVLIQGPLSDVYTEALNKAYAVESMMALDSETKKTHGIYVYCADDDIEETRTRVEEAKGEYKRVVVATSMGTEATEKHMPIAVMCDDMDVEVWYTKNRCLEELTKLVVS